LEALITNIYTQQHKVSFQKVSKPGLAVTMTNFVHHIRRVLIKILKCFRQKKWWTKMKCS